MIAKAIQDKPYTLDPTAFQRPEPGVNSARLEIDTRNPA